MDLQPSHYIAFAAFAQLAVALNFGFVYLDRRSNLLGLKRKFFSTYRAGKTPAVANVANVLKRYKSNLSYSTAVNHAHTKAKEYHTIVTSEWDDEHELSFFSALGVVYGFYSLTLLFLVCLFDMPNKEIYYQNQFLILSQVTLVFSALMIIRSWRKNTSTKIIPTILLYILIAVTGWIFTAHGWVFCCEMDFSVHYHWYILMTYLPIIYYIIRIIVLFLRKTLFIVPMVWWAIKFDTALDRSNR